jgi:excisionase family DNA binding protein
VIVSDESREKRATISIPEVARICGIGRSTAYELAHRGELPFPVLRFGRRLVVSRVHVERALGEESERGPLPTSDFSGCSNTCGRDQREI